jgi:hypothetical protein
MAQYFETVADAAGISGASDCAVCPMDKWRLIKHESL